MVGDGGLRGAQRNQSATRGVVEGEFDGVFGVGDRARFEPQIRHVSGVAGVPPEFERFFVVQLADAPYRDAVGAGGVGFDGVGCWIILSLRRWWRASRKRGSPRPG